ncbi:SDR family NAD(P)-dependent oxidoreductase [Thalassiella azotivora]
MGRRGAQAGQSGRSRQGAAGGQPPVAVVAGASRGLGLLIARELADRGYRLAICSRDPVTLERARAEIAGRGADVLSVPCDVTDPDAVDGFVRAVERRFGRVDVLVAVAGIIQVGPVASMTREHFARAVDTMLWGPVHLSQAVLPGMRRRGSGRIATITSIGGRVSVPHLLPYSTAKFAAVGYSEGLRGELAGTGVKVTTVVPGLMRTGSHLRAHFTGAQEKEYAWFALGASLPLVSMDAERAARRIVDGVLAGRREVVLTPMTHVAMRLHGLAPATTTALMELMGRLLPSAPQAGRGGTVDAQVPGEPPGTVEGRDADRSLGSRTLRAVTVLGRRAARRNNES